MNQEKSDCLHDFNCEIGQNAPLATGSRCKVTKVYLSKHPPGKPTGGWSGLGDGWHFYQPWICGDEGCEPGVGYWYYDPRF